MSSSVDMKNTFQELTKLNNFKKDDVPSLYGKKLSDPTSWKEWAFCSCCKDNNPEIVNAYLKDLVEKATTVVSKGKKLDEEQCATLKTSMKKLEDLSAKYSSKQTKAADGSFQSNFGTNPDTARNLVDLKNNLEDVLKKDETYVSWQKGRNNK